MKKMMFVLLILCLSANGWAAEPEKHGHKWTAIMTAIGAGGGFLVGMAWGLSAYDDAINSDEKVWTTTAICSVGFGVTGFFIGRHIDHSRPAEAKLPPVMTPEGIRWQTQEAAFTMNLEAGSLRPSLLQEMNGSLLPPTDQATAGH